MNDRRLLRVYVSAIAILAVGSYPALVRDYGPYDRGQLGTALLLFLATPVAESLVVHFRLRKSAHSFSLLELPLTAGIILASPLLLVVAYGLGNAMVLGLRRRQEPVKLIFNTSTFVLTATVAVVIFEVLPHPQSSFSPATWAAASVAVFSASLLGTGLVVGVISVAERRLDHGTLVTSLGWGLATASGGISLGLAAAMLASQSPPAVLFITAPLLALYAANRAYESEHQRRQSLQVVFDTSRTLTEVVESEAALFGVLQRCLESMSSDFAAIYLEHDVGTFLGLEIDERGQHRSVVTRASFSELLQLAHSRGEAWSMTVDAPQRARISETQAGSQDLAIVKDATARPGIVEAFGAPLMDGAGTRGVVVVASNGGSSFHLGKDEFALFETVSRSIAAHTRLNREANEDALTGLPNRRRLMQRLDALFLEGSPAQWVLLLIDLDDFKGINDTFGHAFGDGVLREVARRLERNIPNGWMAARLGGDEFAILGQVAPPAESKLIALEALRVLSDPIQVEAQTFQVRASMGLCSGRVADSPADFLRNADTAMYEAKRFEKGNLVEFSRPMHERAVRRYRLGEALREALDAGDIEVVLQPIVNLKSTAIVGGEALSRWEHPEFGTVSPDEFVRVAEDENLSVQLATWVLSAVVSAAPTFPGALSLSMNVSPNDLSNVEFVNKVLAASASLRPHVLGIEVTERLLATDPGIRDVLETLRGAGIKVYVDDFGTGYSSLAYLKDLPVDYLKIPREFVRDIEQGGRALAVVNGVIALGKALGLAAVAEGIESTAQHRLLREAGADLGQGYLFDKAVSVSLFRERLTGAAALLGPLPSVAA